MRLRPVIQAFCPRQAIACLILLCGIMMSCPVLAGSQPATGTANITAGQSILNAVKGNQMTLGVAQTALKAAGINLDTNQISALASLGNVGNMNATSLATLFNNPSIKSLFGSAGNQVGAAANAIALLSNPAALKTPQGIIAAATAVGQALGILPASLTSQLSALTGTPATTTPSTSTSTTTTTGGGSCNCRGVSCCPIAVTPCATFCTCVSAKETGKPEEAGTTLGHISAEFEKHRTWMVNNYFGRDGGICGYGVSVPGCILSAMMLMTNQLATNMVQQAQIAGAFLDAKHQLETQTIFQTMTAKAHKDYHPSAEMCTFGTAARSLAASERRTDIIHTALSQRLSARQNLSGDSTGIEDRGSDKFGRIHQFISVYCNKADNGNGLDYFCKKGSPKKERMNRDISFTRTIDAPLTLDLDMTETGIAKSEDEEDILALSANLYAHDLMPRILKTALVPEESEGGVKADGGAFILQDARAVSAKRSVAQNSFAAMASMKAKGSAESAPFVHAILKEMGKTGSPEITDEEIKKYLGEQPSYFAQMEVLTKKMLQDPVFYTNLYDKPANVKRKEVTLQAIDLMQKRDMFDSLLRSEAVLSVMLETALSKEASRIQNRAGELGGAAQSTPRELPE